MKSLDDLLPNIMPYAPGCARPTAYFGIRQAAIDFCEKTKLWRYEDDFDVTANDSESITTPFGSVLLDIELVQFDGKDLDPKTVKWLDDNCSGWRAGDLTGVPQYVTQTEPDTLRLVPGQDGHVNLYLWLKPSDDAEELPDFMIDQYRMTLAHGALAHILAIPGQSFTNPQLGMSFGGSFSERMTGNLNKGITGQQRARPRTKISNL